MLDTFKFCKTREVKTPTRGDEEAAGIDFYGPEDLTYDIIDEKNIPTGYIPFLRTNDNGKMISMDLLPNTSVLIPSGIHITLPKGYCLKLENKSGVSSKKHLVVKACIVDSNYEGEIHINLHNISNKLITISAGEKIIQGIIYKIELPISQECATLEELYKDKNSVRGTGGFGSTDKK
jgi:deoxyuridine 5'-triphosphate nucleotidohydrolase